MSEYIVRYGAMRFLGVFKASGGGELRHGQMVVARTDRGLEVAEILCPSTPEAVEKLDNPLAGHILRVMTAEDANDVKRIQAHVPEEMRTCQQFIERLGLSMNLVDVEHIFGGERIIVYYLAESRVDFRELVRQLAGEFQTRIEMRQIGVRDEAKLLADYGDCGKPVCCNNHLVQMPPVSMKMAKLQKATLDPTKISGRCGRLKCCLRYEYETYDQLRKELPPVGSMVDTPEGRGKVVGQEILAAQLTVITDDRRRVVVESADATRVPKQDKNQTPKDQNSQPKSETRAESES